MSKRSSRHSRHSRHSRQSRGHHSRAHHSRKSSRRHGNMSHGRVVAHVHRKPGMFYFVDKHGGVHETKPGHRRSSRRPHSRRTR